MRLIRCSDLRLVEFFGEDIPPYAILSHTWGRGEVTYQDFDPVGASLMAGWYKIEKTCEVALQEGLGYAWIDTCCIDKSSSAELSEAINSMFQWYARSRICYVFLEDCDEELDAEQLDSSRWMSRGWTLQELIAPQTVVFFDREWQRLSTRDELSVELNHLTGISREILERERANIDDLLETVPICQKMSWACSRETTRVEDMAYCLMGLFGVNMPLLYGEGSKAFLRLQEEIIRHSNDLTIFAWQAITPGGADRYAYDDLVKRRRVAETEAVRGVLALSPREFADAEMLEPTLKAISHEYTITNKGIRISSIGIQPVRDSSDFVMGLDCYDEERSLKSIFIRPIGGGVFVRVRPDELHSRSWRDELNPNEPFTTSLYLKTSVTPATLASLETIYHGSIRLPKMVGESFHLKHVVPLLQVQGASDIFITRGYSNTVGYATYGSHGADLTMRCDLVVFFGTGNSSTNRPWSYVTTPKDLPGFNHELSAWDENLKRHGLDAQLQAKLWVKGHDECVCNLTNLDRPWISTEFHVKVGVKNVHPMWSLSLEVAKIVAKIE
ncbi:hypothetical protein G7054_g3410 [Neopestalotiopsis clavispora]|nr:hypothetical protein G7054_g3410 [Neopestalotiopsis clavispora]